jgi:hypothetical protein
MSFWFVELEQPQRELKSAVDSKFSTHPFLSNPQLLRSYVS